MAPIKSVAIIGGGVSGLAAGGLLARNGIKVELIEASAKIGGSCSTTNVGGNNFSDGAKNIALPRMMATRSRSATACA